jgi:predicted SprT family Zn-dependent metalloprotease
MNKYRRTTAVGKYFEDTRSIELSSKMFESTIEVLINEIHHQVLHELIAVTACEKYDKIATEFDAFIFEGFSPCDRCNQIEKSHFW